MSRSHTPYIFGEVLFDCFEDGARVLGGAPFNVAWNLQALGDNPLFISRVGRDELGERIADAMEQWGMDTSLLQLDDEHPTGRVDVRIQEGEPHYMIVPDCAYDFIVQATLPRSETDTLVYHGTLALRNPVARQAMDALASGAGVSLFVDVNLRAPWWDAVDVQSWLARARWVKLNRDELDLLEAAGGDTATRARRLCERNSLDMVVVTLGAEGAMACGSDGRIYHVAAPLVERLVDTVGAGDAFASMVIHGLLHDWPIDMMLSRAQEFACGVLGLRGATTTDAGFYDRFRAVAGHK